jgi:hypothetical protein
LKVLLQDLLLLIYLVMFMYLVKASGIEMNSFFNLLVMSPIAQITILLLDLALVDLS